MSRGRSRGEPFEGRLIAGSGGGLLASCVDTPLGERNLLEALQVTLGGLMFSLQEQDVNRR